MPNYVVNVECPLLDSFRVQQVAGLFDVPLDARRRQTFTAELPALHEPWTIGAIVGPSGSGKSTIARQAFGAAVYHPQEWPADRAIIDVLPGASIHEITEVLTAVGLGSPPAWIKPYHVLSNGERFRCDLARGILGARGQESGIRRQESGIRGRESAVDTTTLTPAPCLLTPELLTPELLVFDEFTSVVDRTVARCASAAIARLLRKPPSRLRFVAVTCHYDVLEWLAADWVLDMATGRLARGCLRRPEIRLTVAPCPQSLWERFARHHYLSGGLSCGAACYAAYWDGQPVSFCAVVASLGHAGRKRISRIVTLPDFQGLGIGMRLVEVVCEYERIRGRRVSITASHPAVLAHCRRSQRWRLTAVSRHGNTGRQQMGARKIGNSAGRPVATFEYSGGPLRCAAAA